jgi:hypothetical protein
MVDDVADFEAEPAVEGQRPLERRLEVARDVVAIRGIERGCEKGRPEAPTVDGRVDRDEGEVSMRFQRVQRRDRGEAGIDPSEPTG